MDAAAFPRTPFSTASNDIENNELLIKQMLKTDSLLKIFDECATHCDLKFRSSGLKKDSDDSLCFKACNAKAYSFAKNLV